MARGQQWSYRGKTALITGASSGIGLTFAHELARRGMAVVLVARSEERLRALAADLERTHGVRTVVIAADLSRVGASDAVMAAVQEQGLSIDLLVNNAGFGYHGDVIEQPLQNMRDMIEVNVTALVELSRLLLPQLKEHGSGGIINVASTAAFQPVPHMALYGATKAFVLSFSEALWDEGGRHGVRVVALCPGATVTPFFDVARGGAIGRMRTPEQVVASGLQALERGRSYVIDGWKNYLLAQSCRLAPRSLVVRITERIMRAAAGSGVGMTPSPPQTADDAARG